MEIRERGLVVQETWINSLCSCFNNVSGCLAAACCFECYAIHVTCRMNEGLLCCISCFSPTLAAMRSYIRGKYNIPGSICGDCCAAHCCPCCVLCQIMNEWESRHQTTGIVFVKEIETIKHIH
ncbi:DgyrCDS14641 [Dimorphilus gyrociliatus]|uniref:DgyrCDS14641 n=1 Tax=Dimorphilus gyrociliatus TaxID=2664684 RepID=A0A7I8WEC7_9ANNE|nr:DgyrCDS14641 [Dimorphilus gyrociliatus]